MHTTLVSKPLTDVLLIRVSRCLRTAAALLPSTPIALEMLDHADDLDAGLLARAETRMKQKLNARPGKGRPMAGYLLDHERSGTTFIWGLVAAGKAVGVSPQTVQNHLSRSGRYNTRLEDEFGEWDATITRATQDEEAARLAYEASQPDVEPLAEPAEEFSHKKLSRIKQKTRSRLA